jgi:hypothetical protein
MTDEPIQMDNRGLTETTAKPVPRIGCHDVITPHGVVHYCEADGMMTSAVQGHGDHKPPTSVGMMLALDPNEVKPVGQGLLFQMDPGTARATAASLIKLAYQVERAGLENAADTGLPFTGPEVTNELQQVFGGYAGNLTVTGLVAVDAGIRVEYNGGEIVVDFQPVISAFHGVKN